MYLSPLSTLQVHSVTKTPALAEALTILGYSPIYHMREVFLLDPCFAQTKTLPFRSEKKTTKSTGLLHSKPNSRAKESHMVVKSLISF